MARNPILSKGLRRHSKATDYHRKGTAFMKNLPKKAEPAKAPKKAPNAYPVPGCGLRVKKAAPVVPTAARIRSSITPGTVLILLAGKHRGKRVIALKGLPSGLVLVTGPYKVNGVPIRRVNQAYVIATSTKVDISSIGKIVDKIDDGYFFTLKKAGADAAAKAKASATSDQDATDASKARHAAIAGLRAKEQKEVDALLLKVLKKNKTLLKYLNSKFSLTKGQYPHQMKF